MNIYGPNVQERIKNKDLCTEMELTLSSPFALG